MGNITSSETVREEDVWWTNGSRQEVQMEQQSIVVIPTIQEKVNDDSDRNEAVCETTISSERQQRKKEMEEDLIKFKQDLAREHGRRRELIVERKKEMANLRDELIKEKVENNRLRKLLEVNKLAEVGSNKNQENTLSNTIVNSIKEENEDLRNEVEKLKLMLKEKEMLADKNKELRISLAEMQKELQSVNTQIISFEKERIDYQEHVTALKDIIKVTKEMLRVRESQIEELKKKINSIEELLASKEINILSDDLRQEYERQLRNIRDLRNLYEDRQRADRREKENLHSVIDELKKKVEGEESKNGELTERVTELEEDNSKKYDKIINLESNFGLAKAECSELHAEMNIINQLFSQILVSFNNDQDIDLDNMTKTLEENHDLLTKIVINDESSETSALPKVLLDLIKQVAESKKDNKDKIIENEKQESEKGDKLDTIEEAEENQLSGVHQLNSPEEIVENLPKVWRVLIELLSHQSPPNNEITEKKGENDSHCYKSVETPTGLRKVLSVSKTFIRLKSLILEKKGLEKEMTRLKQLNTHLEGRLSDQEKRLVLVSNELSKTWNFVGKMQKQHQQLHTQEKILRYELAQKRKLLTELKEELEYCRQKWLQARKQNSSTEEQWKQLRSEFASRKKSTNDNSVESGYSDDKSSSDDEDTDFGEKTKENNKNSVPKPNDLSENDNEQSRTVENLHVENKKQDDSLSEERTKIDETPQLHVDTSSDNLENENQLPSVQNSKLNEEIQTEQCSSILVRENETSNVNSRTDVSNSEQEGVFTTNYEENGEALTNTDPGPSFDDLNFSGVEKTEVDAKDEIERLNSSIGESAEAEANENIHADKTSLVSNVNNANEENNVDSIVQCIAETTNTLTTSKSSEICERLQNPMENDESQTDDVCVSTSSKNTEQPTCSHKNPVEAASEFAARREAKMKKLEEQCNELFFSVAKTSLRGMVMSHKLDNLHEMYGENSQQTADQETTTEESSQPTECDSTLSPDSSDNKETNQE